MSCSDGCTALDGANSVRRRCSWVTSVSISFRRLWVSGAADCSLVIGVHCWPSLSLTQSPAQCVQLTSAAVGWLCTSVGEVLPAVRLAAAAICLLTCSIRESHNCPQHPLSTQLPATPAQSAQRCSQRTSSPAVEPDCSTRPLHLSSRCSPLLSAITTIGSCHTHQSAGAVTARPPCHRLPPRRSQASLTGPPCLQWRRSLGTPGRSRGSAARRPSHARGRTAAGGLRDCAQTAAGSELCGG